MFKMKKWVLALTTVFVLAMMVGCGGESESAKQVVSEFGTGWFVHLLLIVVPLLVILVKLFRESEATSDSLISLEGQLRRLNNKIDDLEAGLKGDKKGGK